MKQLYRHKRTGTIGYIAKLMQFGEWCKFIPVNSVGGTYMEVITDELVEV